MRNEDAEVRINPSAGLGNEQRLDAFPQVLQKGALG
jgi:hypothetical protein